MCSQFSLNEHSVAIHPFDPSYVCVTNGLILYIYFQKSWLTMVPTAMTDQQQQLILNQLQIQPLVAFFTQITKSE